MEWLLWNSGKGILLAGVIFFIQLVFSKQISPKWKYMMWALLAIRLVIPQGVESKTSIFNLKQLLGKAKHHTYQSISSDTAAIDKVLQKNLVKKEITTGEFLFLLWGSIAIFLALCVLRKNYRLISAIHKEKPLLDTRWLELLEKCKHELKLHTQLQIIETSHVRSPAHIRFIRPRLLLPYGIFEKMTENEIRFIFIHELIHLRRCDILINWLISFVQIIHWFNPLVWLAFARMRIQREEACDEAVISFAGSEKNKIYGNAIIKLLEFSPDGSAVVGMTTILENKKQIERRIRMIRNFKLNPKKGALISLIFAFTAGIVFLTDAREGTETPLYKKMQSIIIPKLEFDEVKLETALKYLQEFSKKNDSEKKGISFVFEDSDGKIDKNITITMVLEGISLDQAVHYICKAVGLKYKITDDAVVLRTSSNILEGDIIVIDGDITKQIKVKSDDRTPIFIKNDSGQITELTADTLKVEGSKMILKGNAKVIQRGKTKYKGNE